MNNNTLNHEGLSTILEGLILVEKQHRENKEQAEREYKTCRTAGEADLLSDIVDEERNLESWAYQTREALLAAVKGTPSKFNFTLTFTDWEEPSLADYEMED
jgi:hypothetical protein